LPWLDMAHERTVRAFVSLTNEKMQYGKWERIQ
jgi:hypothetical protein